MLIVMRNLGPVVFFSIALAFSAAVSIQAQSTSGTIRGTVLDPSGAAIPAAMVEIQNPVSKFDQHTQADAQGNFQFSNIPFNNYHVTASIAGFQASEQDVSVRSPLPLQVNITMQIGEATSTVTVTDSGDLIETVPTAHTDID